MDTYTQIANWIGWPVLFSVTILLGGGAFWLLRYRLEHQKEINDEQKESIKKLERDLELLKNTQNVASVKIISYQTTIKLLHDATGLCLHSHNRDYDHPGSSNQQQITAFIGSNEDDYWIVKGPHNYPDNYKSGEFVQHGDIIRLEHVNTRKNLHSHVNWPAPVTNQQEVTGYGKNGVGDVNDNWTLEIEGGGMWQENVRIRLIHQRTDCALHSHKQYLPEYGNHHQEVTCFRNRNDDWWRATIYREPIKSAT